MLVIKFEDGTTGDSEHNAALYDGALFREENGLFKGGSWIHSDIEGKEFNGVGVFCGCMHGSMTGTGEATISTSSKDMKWPLWLTMLTEKIFEGLGDEQSKFPAQVIKLIPNEMDYHQLSRVNSIVTLKRLSWLLENIEMGQQQKDATKSVIDLYLGKKDASAADAYAAADATAAYAADAAAKAAKAAYAAAYAAADATAKAAALSAADAADAAAYAADAAARDNYWKMERDWLLSALTEVNEERV